MNLLDQAGEKLILENEITTFLEENYSMQEIQELIQYEDIRTLRKFILPDKMALVALGYWLKDDQGRSTIKYLKNRLYVSKTLWKRYLMDMVTKVEYEVVERFTFQMGQELRHMVIIEEKKRKVSQVEMNSLFEEHKRRTFISILQGVKPINKRFTVKGFQLAQHILVDIPNLTTKIYYNLNDLHWVFNTGLYKSDFVIPFTEQYSSLPKKERFYRYLSMVPLVEGEVSYEEPQLSDSPNLSNRREKEHYINALLDKRYRSSQEERVDIDNTLYSLIKKPVYISIKQR